MSDVLFSCEGGTLALPDPRLILVSREDGGHLVVHPPRPVWERSELTARELMLWGFLVAAGGRAMLDVLPLLREGCINYWEAGNWALNDEAEPRGPKSPRQHRRLHLHLLGRSPHARSATVRWGESPVFPQFRERFEWSAGKELLTAAEGQAVRDRASQLFESWRGSF